MSDLPSALLSELSAHLEVVQLDPSTPLDEQLLEKCELYTTTPEYRSRGWEDTLPLFFQIAGLLGFLTQDPAPLNRFVLKLSAPYSFDHIKDLDFSLGLSLAAKPFHGLILALLEKAGASEVHAEKLANRPDVIQAIVRLWLCTEDAGVASKAADLLVSLLKVSKNIPDGVNREGIAVYGRGPIWKRIFEDKGIYDLFYIFCSLNELPSEETPLGKRDKTLAQARLLEWIPKVGALDWNAITASHHAEVEQAVGLSGDEGLLHFAALKMVEKDDILIHMTLINFYSDLISTVQAPKPAPSEHSSLSLDFLKQQGIHQEMISSYTSDGQSIEQSFLGSRTANYISVYASTYPDNFEESAEKSTILQRLSRTIHSCDPDDLHVLASLPRTSLVPQTGTGEGSPVLSIPISRTTPEALKTLATIFHGPIREEITFPLGSTSPTTISPARQATEQFHARLLCFLYYTRYPSLFADLVHHADTLAMKDNALAALTLLHATLTANWTTEAPPNLASSSYITRLASFPPTGIALLLNPNISGGVLPYLLKPATTFSNLVGGRGDAESAAYKVAMAKFDVLKAVGQRLSEGNARHDVDAMVRRRIAEGPWGVGGGAGSRIGTIGS